MAQEIYHRSEWGNPNEQWGNVYLNADLTNELYKRASEYENSWVTDQLLNGVGTKPSIILTPTAYEDGTLNSVKPSNGDGDFDFTRGSSATRVNEQGLIEDVQILSGNLVQNGNFEQIGSEEVANGNFSVNGVVNTSSYTLGWQSTDSNINITNNELVITNGATVGGRAYATDGVNSINVVISGQFYKLVYTITENNDNATMLYHTGGTYVTAPNTVGTHTIYYKATGTIFILRNNTTNTTVKIDNVSVKEVGQNWQFDTGWNMGDGKAVATDAYVTYLTSTQTLTIGKKYKITYTISNYVKGLVRYRGNATTVGVSRSANGTYTDILTTTTSTARFQGLTDDGGFTGSIDNISVVEVTDDTDLPRINYTNFDYEDVLGDELASPLDFTSDWTSTGATSITENSFQVSGSGIGVYFSLEADKKYKIKVSNVSGDISIRYRTSNGGAGTVAGNFDEFIIINTVNSTTPNIYLRASSETTVTVGDVTIKELTEDVVVPYSGEGALLLEPARTNLNTFSDPTDAQKGSTSYASVTFQDNFNWGLGGVLENAIVFGDNSTTRYAYYSSTVSSGTVYSLSFFIKMDDNSVPIPATDFLLVLAGTSIASGYNVESYGNNVYRVSVSGTASASNTANGILKVASHSTKGFKISAFQLEQGSCATSYIPTNGSTVTRLADVCNNSGSSDLINSTEGVLYAEISALTYPTTPNNWMTITDGTAANSVGIVFEGNSAIGRIEVGGVNQAFITKTIDYSNLIKVAFKYKENDFSFWINGVKTGADTSGVTFPLNTLNSLQFTYGAGSNKWAGKTKCVAVFKEALSDTELQKLTTI